jgi:hypothetical protein
MTDPFEYDDAAYLLGALSDEETAAFEAHLATCPECTARVAELVDMPARLRGVTEADLQEHAAQESDAGPVPDTLLPALVREVRRARRRGGLLAAGGALAAACVAAVLAIVLTTSSTGSSTPPTPAGVAMHPLVATPVHARVALTAERWGTQITLHCRYAEAGGVGLDYEMVVRARGGEEYRLGGWHISGGQAITYIAGAPLPPASIASVVVKTASGLPILRLRT